MPDIKLKRNERAFNVKPIGIKYICELCNEGEMIAVSDEPAIINAIDSNVPFLRKHRCTNCKGEMRLPKTYPYIEWVPDENEEGSNGTN